MTTSEIIDYKTIVNTIHTWPLAQRLMLVQDILRMLMGDLKPVQPKQDTLSQALGLLATDNPPPSDNEVKLWLEDARMEKFSKNFC